MIENYKTRSINVAFGSQDHVHTIPAHERTMEYMAAKVRLLQLDAAFEDFMFEEAQRLKS